MATDLAEVPRYTFPDAAHFLKIPPATLRSWISGRDYETKGGRKRFQGLIDRPDPADSRLSYSNLVEAHVLNALRKAHSVPMHEVRDALVFAQDRFKIKRLLLSKQLLAAPGSVFLEKVGALVNIGKRGQTAMREIVETYLERVEWNSGEFPSRLYPLIWDGKTETPKVIAISPRLASGSPFVVSHVIKTSVIADRYYAGELPSFLASDYGLDESEIHHAIWYERRAA